MFDSTIRKSSDTSDTDNANANASYIFNLYQSDKVSKTSLVEIDMFRKINNVFK